MGGIYDRDDQFARQFIGDLHDGGLPRVRDRMKPSTLEGVRDPEAEFAAMMRALPPGPIDSIRFSGGGVEQDGSSSVSKLHYRVYGGRRAAQVDLWIETSRKTQYVETLRVTDVTADVSPAGSAAGVRGTHPDHLVVAPGFSCRHQIADFCDNRRSLHTAELLAMANTV
ncbi:hypothetical protein [Longimicrobium sp.]|uniref:hypothetical protein n=1 Tax=Longimicrobium sp. TaxID=2029185 RepID=UPI003B3A978F